MTSLNSEQLRAVHYIDGPLLVLAGAGSGKTRVITQKIVYLIQSCGISARHIAAVTFTNKAAQEMKTRVKHRLAGQDSKGLQIATFHTLGLTIIRHEHAHLDLKPGFSIFDAHDTFTLLQDIMVKQDANQVQQVQQQISRWKNDLLLPQDISDATGQIYAEYNRHLRAYNALDFDDLIMLPVLLLQNRSDILDKWQNRIRFLLVDEYQDTNLSQYRLVKLLAGARGALTVVGDDDQSIYAWRGARAENILQLQQDFPRLEVIKLEQNYRSTQRILRTANCLIKNNPHIFEKKLWSQLGLGDPIRVITTKDDEDEAERVVTELIHHKFKHRTDYKDYAILYRNNHQSRLFEKALRQQQIPYHLSGGTSFFAHTEVKDWMAYLRLLVNADDNKAFLRIINTPRRGIGPQTLEKLAEYAGHRQCSLFAAIFELGIEQTITNPALEKLRHFAHHINLVADQAQRGDTMAAIRGFYLGSGYETWLYDNSDNPKGTQRRLDNIQDLFNWLNKLLQNQEDSVTIQEAVNKLALIDMLDQSDNTQASEQVHLSTLHAAKGLEFPYVFLIGMEEELLPHRTSIEQDFIEEERRLAYVGITRAKQSLIITLTEKRKRYGEWLTSQPSRFLSELPAEDLAWEGGTTVVSSEERQEKGKSHLSHLRSLLVH